MGPMSKTDAYLSSVPAEEIAHITLREVLNGAANNVTPQTVMDHVGKSVEAYVQAFSQGERNSATWDVERPCSWTPGFHPQICSVSSSRFMNPARSR